MPTQIDDIRSWIGRGQRANALFMLVVCDSFDHEDYPVYIDNLDRFKDVYDTYDGKNMQRIMEVYDLQKDTESQLSEPRAWHYPEGWR